MMQKLKLGTGWNCNASECNNFIGNCRERVVAESRLVELKMAAALQVGSTNAAINAPLPQYFLACLQLNPQLQLEIGGQFSIRLPFARVFHFAPVKWFRRLLPPG